MEQYNTNNQNKKDVFNSATLKSANVYNNRSVARFENNGNNMNGKLNNGRQEGGQNNTQLLQLPDMSKWQKSIKEDKVILSKKSKVGQMNDELFKMPERTTKDARSLVVDMNLKDISQSFKSSLQPGTLKKLENVKGSGKKDLAEIARLKNDGGGTVVTRSRKNGLQVTIGTG